LSIIVFLVLGRFHDDVDRERKQTASDTLRRSQNLVRTRDAVIFGLAKLADSRDPETGDHLERMSIYSTMLASALQRHPKFADKVTPAFARLIGISTALHDIGKVGIEDSILRKPGKLSAAQTARMRKHTTIGGECLREIELRLGSSNFLQMAREIAFAHHERWDGAGYPNGIAGDAIPLAARIAAIADVYDALSSKRVYKHALQHEECIAIIRNEAGKGFDSDLVDVWLTIENRFRDVALQYASDSADEQGTTAAEEVDETERGERQDALVSQATGGER
jgi:putative two-component system response regulator